jgi:predicted RNase H-like HicB family nuclease
MTVGFYEQTALSRTRYKRMHDEHVYHAHIPCFPTLHVKAPTKEIARLALQQQLHAHLTALLRRGLGLPRLPKH